MMNKIARSEADRSFQQGLKEYENDRLASSLQIWQKALRLYREGQDYSGEAQTLKHLGVVSCALENYVESTCFWQQYLSIIKKHGGDSADRLHAYNQLGNIFYYLENYQQAINSFQRGLELIRSLEIVSGVTKSWNKEAQTGLNKIGLCYTGLKDYEKAIGFYKKSLEAARELQDIQSQGWTLDDLGKAYAGLKYYPQAISYYQESLSIATALQDLQSQEWALDGLGDVYYESDDHINALEIYHQLLETIHQAQSASGDSNSSGEGWALCKLGAAYTALNNPNKANEYLLRSLSIAQALQERELEGQVFGKLGNAYVDMGLYDEAVKHQKWFLEISQELNRSELEAQALIDLGNAYYFRSSYSSAIDCTQKGLALARQLKDKVGERRALSTLGNAHDDLGRSQEAVQYHQDSLEIAQELKSLELEGGVLNNLGGALFRAGNFIEAESVLRRSIHLWDNVRDTLGDEDNHRIAVFNTQAKTYRHLQQVLIAQEKVEAALEVSEQGRARALAHLLSRRSPEVLEAAPQAGYLAVEKIRTIAKQSDSTLVEYSIIYHSLVGKQQPKYRSSEILIWVIHPTGKVYFQRVDTSFLKSRGITLRDLIKFSRESTGVEGINTTLENSQILPGEVESLKQLYDILIEPIASFLLKEKTAKVVFIPQGSLFFTPFSALPDANGVRLIEKYTITTVPSIQVLDFIQQRSDAQEDNELRIRQEAGKNEALVVGNPTVPTITAIEPPIQLQNLDWAESEAQTIARMLNTHPITGKKATKGNVISKMLDARLIHLAAHGLLDDIRQTGIPGAIVLASEDGADGLLTSDEIYSTKLNAKLVVLSACSTGKGNLTGDGVVGLSRCFIAAGASAVVVSLWTVNDLSTALLMMRF